MDIQDMRIFARVAAVQNLSAVGSELGLTPGTISKRIQSLEDELSRPVVRPHHPVDPHYGGGRRVSRPRRAHPVGDRSCPCQRRRQGEQAQGQAQDRGAGLPRSPLCGARAVRVRARFPRSTSRSTCTTGRSTCRRTATTWPFAPAQLSDSSLIAKRLAPDRQVVAASAAYLARAGRPLAPEDLARHQCLVLGETRQWSFSKERRRKHGAGTGRAAIQQRRAALPRGRGRPRAYPRPPNSRCCANCARASWCRCCPTTRSPPTPRFGRSIRVPSTAAAHARASGFPCRLVSQY